MTTNASAAASTTRRDRAVQTAIAIILALLVIGGALILWTSSSQSSAQFADAEILEDNRLGAATLDIEAGRDGVEFAVANLAPGDQASAHVDVANVGSLPLATTIRVETGAGPLAAWLRYSAWLVPDRCRPDDVGAGRAEPLAEDVAELTASTDLTGGERLRLGAGESVILCLGVQLSLDAGNDVQGQSVTVDLVLDAVHDLDAEEAS